MMASNSREANPTVVSREKRGLATTMPSPAAMVNAWATSFGLCGREDTSQRLSKDRVHVWMGGEPVRRLPGV